MNTALGSCTRLVLARGSTWLNRCSACSSAARWRDTIEGWNRRRTPFLWGGKRHARRDRAYARRHRQGGSGATTQYVLPRRIRSVRYYRQVGNAIVHGK